RRRLQSGERHSRPRRDFRGRRRGVQGALRAPVPRAAVARPLRHHREPRSPDRRHVLRSRAAARRSADRRRRFRPGDSRPLRRHPDGRTAAERRRELTMDSPGSGGHADHSIAHGLRGWLEGPDPDAAVAERIVVVGWAFPTAARMVEVWADVDGKRLPLEYGTRRDDVAAAYPDEECAGWSGFSGVVTCDAPDGGAVRIEVRGRLENGRSVRLFTRRLEIASARGPRPFGRDWWRIRWAQLTGVTPTRTAAPLSVSEALETASRAA